MRQEALTEVWRKRHAYDPLRGSWWTFSERVVANKLASLMRSMHAARCGHFTEESPDDLVALMAPNDGADLRVDVWRVLAGVAAFDRSVALYLREYSPSDTSQRLGVSRAAVYRAIGRLRKAFTDAGLSPRGRACGRILAAGSPPLSPIFGESAILPTLRSRCNDHGNPQITQIR